jgi:hypothetical protein
MPASVASRSVVHRLRRRASLTWAPSAAAIDDILAAATGGVDEMRGKRDIARPFNTEALTQPSSRLRTLQWRRP